MSEAPGSNKKKLERGREGEGQTELGEGDRLGVEGPLPGKRQAFQHLGGERPSFHGCVWWEPEFTCGRMWPHVESLRTRLERPLEVSCYSSEGIRTLRPVILV